MSCRRVFKETLNYSHACVGVQIIQRFLSTVRAAAVAGLLVLFGGPGMIGPAIADASHITLASTTSIEQSGLFRHLVPMFREETGIDVRVVAVGTGQAFAMARAGDADVLLVHDRDGEERFLAEGYGSDRRDIMHNDFIILGPESDPAGVREAESAIDALQRIAVAEAAFASRGDDSGTHRAERRLWEEVGITPSGRWYRELGSGMGSTLNTAAGMEAYVLSDRASWLSFRNRQALRILFQDDDALLNPYASLRIDRDRHPHLKHELAARWHDWLISGAGQAAIADFVIDGEQPFVPATKP